MVMRGDGGAIDPPGLRREPARTLYSGPAASVAGVLRTMRLDDAVIVEVGGTSTNVAAVKSGRPALSYVQRRQPRDRRASPRRACRRRRRGVDVAGAPWPPLRRRAAQRAHGGDAVLRAISSRPSWPASTSRWLHRRPVTRPNMWSPGWPTVAVWPSPTPVLPWHSMSCKTGTMRRGTPTVTRRCWRSAAAGALLRLDGAEVARRMLVASAQAIGELVAAVCKDYSLRSPATDRSRWWRRRRGAIRRQGDEPRVLHPGARRGDLVDR